MSEIRLNAYLSKHKIASRREADRLIEEGKVYVNGERAVLGQKVSDSDEVEVRGNDKKYQYYCYYKPRGVLTHHFTGSMGEDITDRIKADHGVSGVYPIGRLDKDSEGLILLSNDGRLTKAVLEPQSMKEKEYEVAVDKTLKGSDLKKMEGGMKIEHERTQKARTIQINEKMFSLILTEGKKHQVRRMCAALGYQVQKLRRVRIMNLTLGTLRPGDLRTLTEKEVSALLR